MAKQPKGRQAVTANRLDDGRVVYFTAAGGWSEQVDDAAVAEASEAEALLRRARAAAPTVIDPYAIEIAAERPGRFRERLRALGPSVRPDLGKQAGSL